ncbi:tRNA pseudouridine synthase D, partial [mine drainage metagenome]
MTEQYFCINAPVSDIPYIGTGIEITEMFRSNTLLRLGYLRGNRFMIRVESAGSINDRVSETASFIMQNGGFPNFYGIQRFGSIRPITHRVGKYILQGRMDDAAMEYIYDPEFDSEDYRRAFFDTRDVKAALRDFPNNLRFERSILGRIEETGKLSEGLSRVPIELGKMFVHAYQSRVFNILLSRRIGNSMRMDEVSPG